MEIRGQSACEVVFEWREERGKKSYLLENVHISLHFKEEETCSSCSLYATDSAERASIPPAILLPPRWERESRWGPSDLILPGPAPSPSCTYRLINGCSRALLIDLLRDPVRADRQSRYRTGTVQELPLITKAKLAYGGREVIFSK